MNNQSKNILLWAGLVALFIFAFGFLRYVKTYEQSIEPSSFRSFSVSAEAKELAIPDIAQFSFSTITEGGKNINQLMQDNTVKVNAAIDFLKKSGLEAKDIQTTGYNLSPRYQYYDCSAGKPCPPPEIVGYTITQTVSVKIRDFSKIGEILGGVVEKGANSVSQLSFTVDDPFQIELKAKIKAIQLAQQKAKTIAQAAGFKLGRLLAIDESLTTPAPLLRETFKAAANAPEASPTPTIEAGSQEFIATATLKYEIR